MPYASSIQIVNDANGTAYGFLANDGQLLQCRWDSQAERWVEAQAVPGAVGGNAVQATYLDNLWANEQAGSDASGQSWDPGIVLLYRKGQDSQAEIYAVFGGWNDNGELQWSQEVQLTDDTVNDKEFSLVAAANGQFVLVTQKQQEIQSLAANLAALESGSITPEQTAQKAIDGLVRPDSDLYTTSFQILNNGPGQAPELQKNPVKTTLTGSPTWTTVAPLESSAQPAAPAPALPDGAVGSGTDLSRASLFAANATAAGGSGIAQASSAPQGVGASETATPAPGATAKSWEVGKGSNPTSVDFGYIEEVARWKIGAAFFQRPDDAAYNPNAIAEFKPTFMPRLGLALSGFFGLTNEGGPLAFRSLSKLSIGAIVGSTNRKDGGDKPYQIVDNSLRSRGRVFNARSLTYAGPDLTLNRVLSKKIIGKLMLAGAVGSTTYYEKGGNRNPVLLQAREAASFDAGLILKRVSVRYTGSVPTFYTLEASVSNAVGFQWVTSIGNGVDPLPLSGLSGKIIGGIGDSETYLTIASGFYQAYKVGQDADVVRDINSFGPNTYLASEEKDNPSSKEARAKNFTNAIIGTSSAIINPAILAKNASQYQDSATLNYRLNSGYFDTTQLELIGKINGAFNARASFINKYNITSSNQAGAGAWLFDLAVGAFGAYQPVFGFGNTYPSKSTQATIAPTSSGSALGADAPAPATENGSIVYAPSQGSSLYWASPGDNLLSGQNIPSLYLQTLIASSANLMQTSVATQTNGGTGLNDGTYTNVRLIGVTPGGEDDLAEATVVVAGGIITSLVITKGGTYVYLPPYSASGTSQPQQVVVVPDLVSVNASTGTSIVSNGAIGKALAKPPTIILSSSQTSSWTSQAAAVIQSVVVKDGGSGYAPLDADSQQTKSLPGNYSPYIYTGVGYSVYQGNTLVTSLVPGSTPTATVTLINGAIDKVSLDQPFYYAALASTSYSLELKLPAAVVPTQSAVLTATSTTLVYNNFVDEHSFFTQRSVPGAVAGPSTSGVYIADGNNDQAPLLASEKGNAISSRVVFVDAESDNLNNLNTYYLNAIQWNPSNDSWIAGSDRDALPNAQPWLAGEQQFSLARLPVATKLPSTSSFTAVNLEGGDLVAWVEVIDRPVPNSGSSGPEDYQNFYDNYFNNQQIAFSIKTTGPWQTNPINYIAADNTIIDDLDIALVPGSTPDDLQVLLTWSETSIAAVKGLAPLAETPQSGKAPTVIKAALFDPKTQAFTVSPQPITWASPDAVGIGVADLSISSMPIVQADGSLSQAPAIFWSQNVAVPYEQAVLTSNPYIYLQMSQGQSGFGNYNIGSIGDSPAAVTSASSTGLDFNVSGALGINSDAAIENIDGTGVLSTGVGSLNTFLPPTAAPSSDPSSGVARSPYTIEFWARIPETGNSNGAGLFALGQPSITQGQLPTGWLLSSSFVVDQISWQDALGRGLIESSSIPAGTDLNTTYAYAWAVVADGTNTTALGGNGGSGLYSNALQITNLQAGTTLAGVNDFLASYGVAADALKGTSGSAAGILAEVPATSLEFDTALLDGTPNSSLNTIAVSTDQALMNSGLVTTASTDYTNNGNLQTLFQNLWDYQQKAGKAKVNFGLNPSTSAASDSVPPAYAQETYGGLSLDFALTHSTAVSVNAEGQVVFDVGSSTSLLSTATTSDGTTPLSINDGNWHYIVATYLPDIETQVVNNQPVDVPLTTGTASLYIDNQLVGQTALSDVYSPATEAEDALLIYLNNGGAIDELALYQQSLTGIDLSTPSNPSGDWPVMNSADAAGLLASLGVNIGGLSTAPGVDTGAVNLHWGARSVDPNGAENATFYTTYDETSKSWNAAQLLNPVGAPVATQPSGSRSTSLQDADLLQINPGDWSKASFNPAKQQLQSVTVNLLSSSDPSTILNSYTLDPSQVLIGEQTLLSRQPRATSSDLAYTFLNNTPAVGLLVQKSKLSDSAPLYSYELNFSNPSTNTPSTFSSAQLNAGGVNAVLPVSGTRISTAPNPSSFTSNPLYPQQIVSADILEQAPYQLQYVDSGEVIRSQQNPADTSKGFGLSQVAGRYTSTITNYEGTSYEGTAAGWLAISQPFTPSADSNPAGRVWIQFTGLYPSNPSSGNPPVGLSPTTWLNALARSNFNADAPNLPLLQDAKSQSSSGGLLIQADPTEGWGGNLGRIMLVADLNSDGCDELIIAAPNTNSGGSVYIISGSWMQLNLNSNPKSLDLNNPDALGSGVVTVLTADLAGQVADGSDAQNSQFGSALAFDGTALYIGAPTYSSEVVSGESDTAVAVGAVYRYGPPTGGGTAALTLYQTGIGGSLVEKNPSGVATTTYWGERLGSSLAATTTPGSNGNAATVELAIGAPGLVAGLQYSGNKELKNDQEQAANGDLSSITASNQYGDGALLMVQLPSTVASSINTAAGSGSYTAIANAAEGNANEASAYMQRLKALMTDPIAQATTFYDQSLTANEIGAVYYKKSGATTQQSVFYGASPWNTGSTGFGSSIAFADLTNSNANTLVIGADTSGGSGAAYFINPGQLPATTLAQSSGGVNQYLAHLAAGLILHGQNANDHFGNSLVSTGDVNADSGNSSYTGYDDLLITAYNAQSGMGLGYLIFGADNILGNPTDPASGPYTGSVSAGGIGTITNNSGSVNLNILTESGSASEENVGLGSFNANDVNGDGINDVLLGGRGAGNGYLTWGKPYLQDISNFQLNKLASDQGFLLEGLATTTEASLRSIGDFNGDGYGDFYSVTPGDYLTAVRVELGGSTEAILADYLYNDFSFYVDNGTQILSAGDLNADGFDDLALFLSQNLSSDSQGAGSTTGILYGRPSDTLPLASGFGLLAPAGLTPPSQDVEYGLSDAAPCFLAVGDTIYAVVKSYNNDSLWFSRSADSGNSWATWVDISAGQPGITSSLPVSLAYYENKLVLAFVNGSQSISLSSWDPSTSSLAQWSAPIQVQLAGEGSASTTTPATALAPLLLNQGTELSLYWVDQASSAITAASSTTPAVAAGWSPPTTLSSDAAGTPILSATALAGTLLEGSPVLAYGQAGGSGSGSGSTLGAIALITPDSGGVLWQQQDSLPLTGSVPSNAPGLAATGTGLALTYTNADQQIVVNQLRLLEAAGDSPTWLINTNPQWQSSVLEGVSSSLGSSPVVVNDLLLVGTVNSSLDVGLQAVSSSDAVPWLTWMDSTVQLPDGNGGWSIGQVAGDTGWQANSIFSGYVPSFAELNGVLYAVAQSYSDSTIWWSSSLDGGRSWQEWDQLLGEGNNSLPSLVAYDDLLYLAYSSFNSSTLQDEVLLATFDPSSGSLVASSTIPAFGNAFFTLLVEGEGDASTLALYYTDQNSIINRTSTSLPLSVPSSWSSALALPFSGGSQTASGNLAATYTNGTTYIAYQTGTQLKPSSSIDITYSSNPASSESWDLIGSSQGVPQIPSDSTFFLDNIGLTANSQGLVLSYSTNLNAGSADEQFYVVLNSGSIANGEWSPSDVATTTTFASPNINKGSVYSIFSTTNDIGVLVGASLGLQSIFTISASLLTADQTRSTLTAAGDLNNDGYDDLIVTANHVVYSAGPGTQMDLATGLRFITGAANSEAIAAANKSNSKTQNIQLAPAASISSNTPLAVISGQSQLTIAASVISESGSSTVQSIQATFPAAGVSAGSVAEAQSLFSGQIPIITSNSQLQSSGWGQPIFNTTINFGDLNADGYADYLAPNGLSDIYTGDGAIAYSIWSIRAAGDVNGNGFDDVLLALSPIETAGQFIQTVLVDGALFNVKDNQFSLQQAQGKYETGWTSAGLKAPLNPYLFPYSVNYIPSLQVWFEAVQSYEPTTTLSTLTTSNSIDVGKVASTGYTASAVDENGTSYVVLSPPSTPGISIELSYGDPALDDWSTVSVSGINVLSGYIPMVTSVAIYQGMIFVAYNNGGKGGTSGGNQLWIASADLTSDFTQSSSWTNYNPSQIEGQGELVNEGNRLALYYTSYNRTNNPSGSDFSLYSTYLVDPSSGASGWQGNGKALTDANGTVLTASSLAATRFQGKTVLAFYSGSYSNSSYTLTTAQSVSSETGANWNTYQTNLGINMGAAAVGAPVLGLTANSTQIYLNTQDGPFEGTSNYIATGGAFDQWSNEISASSNTTATYFVSNSQLYQAEVNGDLYINQVELTPTTANQISLAGYSIDGNIDINADGYMDILISDPSNPPEGLANQYVLFGGDYLDIANQIGTPSDDTLLGTPLADIIVALDGSDRIEGLGGKDVILAGAGDDQISLIDNNFLRIDAGAGIDTLLLQGPAKQNWNFSEANSGTDSDTYYIRPGNRLKSVELISSVDYGANTLSFDSFGIQNLNDDQVLFLVTDAQDTIQLSSDFSRNDKADIVYGGARWNGFTASDSAGVVFVLVPTSQTAVNSEGENSWLASHVLIGSTPTQKVSATTTSVEDSSDRADDFLNSFKQQAGARSVQTDDYTVTAMAAPEGGSLSYKITRQGAINKSLAILYSSTSDKGTASLGVDCPAVLGVLHLKPGEISKTISVPTYPDRIIEGRKESASLVFQQVEPHLYLKELHLVIEPIERVLLSGLKLNGSELQLRADVTSPDQTSVNVRISKRESADATTFTASQEVTLADFKADGRFNLATGDPLPLDQDFLANQQVSTRLGINFEDRPDQPLVSLLGPDPLWQTTVQLVNGTQVRFQQDAPLTSWRADSGAGLVTFGLESGSNNLTLISNAQGGSAGSLNSNNANGATSWQTTEGKAIGSRSITDGQNLKGSDWTPTASLDGVSLALLNLAVDGNQVTASFEGGVTGVFWQADGNAPSLLPVPVAVEVLRLAGYNNSLGFYSVDSITGMVAGINPGETGYLQAALARSQEEDLLLDARTLPAFGATSTFNSLPLDTRERYGVLLLQNGDPSVIFSSFAAANEGGATQMVSLSDSSNSRVLGIEDMSVAKGLGDNDFNDIIVKFQGVSLGLF